MTLALVLAGITTLTGYLLLPELLGQSRSSLVPLAQAYLLAFVPFNFLALALLSVDLGQLRFGRYNTLRLLVPALYLAGLLTLWASDAVSVALVAAVNCAPTVLAALARLALQGRALLAWPCVEDLRDLLRLAVRFHPAALMVLMTAHADRLAVLLFWDNAALGHYVAALTLAGSGLGIVTGAFQRVLFPHVAQAGEAVYRAQLLARGVRQATISLAALSVPLAVATPWLVDLLFGPSFREAVPVAIALIGAYPLVALKMILIQGLRALGEAWPGFASATISLVLFFALIGPVGEAAGLMGVAMSLAAAEAVGLWYLTRHLGRSFGVTARDLWGPTRGPIEEMWTRILGSRPFFRRDGATGSLLRQGTVSNLGRNGAPHVHVAMLGAQRHYAVPRLLARAGMLGRFYTDVYAGSLRCVSRLLTTLPDALRPRWAQRFLGRSAPELPQSRVVAFGILGLRYFVQRRLAREVPSLERVYAREAAAFNRSVIQHLKSHDGSCQTDVLFAFNGAAVELLEYAKARGLSCVLEQTIAPREVLQALLDEELRRWPGWQPGLHLQHQSVIEHRERREWQLADVIVGGSDFVIDGLRECGVPAAKCRLVPYGIPLDCFQPRVSKALPSKLRILFAGEVGLRKGAQYLLEALRVLGSRCIEARFAGIVALNPSYLQPYMTLATFLGPVPRVRMPAVFRWADVFVLPSICEGSALVTYEALASGLPVITTPNAGAPLRDGLDGLLVPPRDVEGLASAIDRFASDADFRRSCSQNALLDRQRLGLNAYGERLVRVMCDAAGVPNA